MKHHWTRKEFIKASIVGGGAALLGRRPLSAARSSANGDIRVAVVGINGKGAGHIRQIQKMPGVRIAALCDVDSAVLRERVDELAKENIKVSTYADFREVLDDASVDAVVLATPNHWHSLQTIWACQAGKDVYVEKPISHNVWEGRKCVEAARKYKRIVQAGTQSRSAEELHRAFAYIKEGNIGKIQWVRGLCYKPRESIGNTSGPQPVPASVDYDLWSGPAPLVPPHRNGPHGTIHYDWHWFWNYGGGDIANQGIHQMDVARWFLGDPGLPPAVMSIGGRFGYDDDAETPNTQIAVFDYEKAPLIFEVRGLPSAAGAEAMDNYRGIRIGVIVQCEGGHFSAGSSGGGLVYDNHGKRIEAFTGTGGGGHMENFISAVRSRKESDLNAQIEGGHISSALCHLANISYRLGAEKSNDAIEAAVQSHAPAAETFSRMLEHLRANNVDTASTPTVMGPTLEILANKERFATEQEFDIGYWANTLLRREYRTPYVVPVKV
ncbi:MAG: Gfo/Idh/MocA family protein [Opitutaceae bacterium]